MSIGAAGYIGQFHDADRGQRALDMLRRLQEEKARVGEGRAMYLEASMRTAGSGTRAARPSRRTAALEVDPPDCRTRTSQLKEG